MLAGEKLKVEHFAQLRDLYEVPWFDDPTGTLEVTYANGQTKRIEDYGITGTFGLRRVHALKDSIRTARKW